MRPGQADANNDTPPPARATDDDLAIMLEAGAILSAERIAVAHDSWSRRPCPACKEDGRKCSACRAWRTAYARWKASGLPVGESCRWYRYEAKP